MMIATANEEKWQETAGVVCSAACRAILEGASFNDFLQQMYGMTKVLLDALEVPAEIRGEHMVQAMATNLALEVWNATPIPDNRFRPRKIDKPERNAPCLCGSGKKFKQCCGAVDGLELGIDENVMLAHVLSTWPKKRIKELPIRELSPQSLGMVAERWLDDGREKDAIFLLEALFQHLPELDARAEDAADILLNAYLQADMPRKKQSFVDALKAAPDKTLRSAAWQRQATMHSDRDDYAAAWAAFREAQRLTPNAPALSHLEVLLLISEGRPEEARARADFWAARLARDTNNDYSELIDKLHDMASGTPEAALRLDALSGGAMMPFVALLDQWPEPQCLYGLRDDAELVAKEPLDRIEDKWRAVSPFGAGRIDDPAWLQFLFDEPRAAQSFLVLHHFAQLLLEWPENVPGAVDAVRGRLLQRAEALRQAVLAHLQAHTKKLPWGCLDNRPLHLLAASYANHLRRERPQETLDLLRWAVLTANPEDNLGLRELLIHELVAAGQADEALSVAERYPGDFAFTQYGCVLALRGANRLDEAATALAEARAQSPRIWKTLVAASPKAPRLMHGYYTVGGADEAWLYRQNHLDLWQKSGALQWAVGVTKASTTPRQRKSGAVKPAGLD